MPGLGGLHVLDELGQLEIESRKVVLTASLDRKELLSALRLGADGYMLKETEPDDLRLYIRNCVQGVIVLDDCLVTLLANDDDVLEGERHSPGRTDRARSADTGAHFRGYEQQADRGNWALAMAP
jgi:Response regulator containing a CheY-like receiver domain and an HTH DNA-binding domain